ncbi:hypothetical protein HBH49_019500 [Parastagonospora nodorum]|nr:hypothetical protein HBH49_019500 [Parastagonospora nodorum]
MLFLTSCATEKVHVCAADSLSSTMTVYNYIKKDKNADLIYDRRLAGELATAESVTAKDSNYVNIFGLDFAFSFANILSLIAFIISYCLFADELVYALNRATVVLIIILRLTPSTLLAKFIPTTKIRDLFLKTLENAAKSGILLACADRRIRQCYLTICAILRCLDKGHDDFVYLVNCFGWKHYNFNIHVSLATDTLHLLLKGLVMKMLDFMQDMLDDIYPGTVVSLLFVSKAPFALHFIRAVCDLVTLAQYKRALERMNVFKEEFRVYRRTLEEEKNFNYSKWHALIYIIQDIRMYGALDSICTGANSEAHYITIVKQFYSMTNKKEVTRPLLFCRLRWLILGIQPYLIKLPLSEVAANIAISDFIHAAAVFRSSGKRHNDPEYCDEEVVRCVPNWQQTGLWRRDYSRTVTDSRVVAQLYLILTIIDYTCYDKDRKHIAYIGAFSEVLLFNNNRQIDNTTGMLTFKFYDLSTIIRSVHLVLRDLPNLTTCTTMSYYVNNYIN